MTYASEARREGYYISQNSLGFHRIAYSDWGPSDGPITICVHGLTCNGRDMDWLAHALAQSGQRVIAVDLAGRGRSDFLGNSTDYNFAQYLHDLTALFGHLQITEEQSISWIGTSLGGLLGMYMAGLSGSPIKKIVINDVGPELPPESLKDIGDYVSREISFKSIQDLEKALRFWRQNSWGPLTDEQWHAMAENNARALPTGALTFAFDNGIGDVFKAVPLDSFDFWSSWDNMTQPCLLFRGINSDLFPQNIADNMLQRGPGKTGNVQLEVLDGCAHAPSLAAPYQIQIILNWYENNS